MLDEIVDPRQPDQNEEKPVIMTELFSGPIPHPRVLEQYKDVDAALPMMLMKMASEEQNHRHDIERQKIGLIQTKLNEQAAEQKDRALFGSRGQMCGVLIWLSLIGLIVFLACLGFSTAVEYGVLVLGGAAFASLMRDFIHPKKESESTPADS